MKKSLTLLTALFVLVGATIASAYDLPTLNVGDTYDATEEIRITSPELGQGGYVEVTGTSTYTVSGTESVTQEQTGQTYDCYKLEGSGTVTAEGEVFNAGGFITGPVRIENGTYTSTFYYSTSDFSTVKKKRVISGNISYKAGAVWLPLGALTINENEEYEMPLGELKFPFGAGDTWSQNLTIHAFGSLDVPVLGAVTFNEPLSLDMDFSVAANSAQSNGCDAHKVTGSTNTGGATTTLENDYCCMANFPVYYAITNLPLGDTGNIDYVRMNVTSYSVSGDSCGSAGGDPSIELAANGTEFNAGEELVASYTIKNPSGNDYADVQVWLLVDILGTIYTHPNYSDTNLGPAETIQLTNGYDMTTEFIRLTNPGIGVDVPLIWYAGLLTSSFEFVPGSGVASATTTLK